MEQFHFGAEIRNVVGCEGVARVERHERADQWGRRSGADGLGRSWTSYLAALFRFLSSLSCTIIMYLTIRKARAIPRADHACARQENVS